MRIGNYTIPLIPLIAISLLVVLITGIVVSIAVQHPSKQDESSAPALDFYSADIPTETRQQIVTQLAMTGSIDMKRIDDIRIDKRGLVRTVIGEGHVRLTTTLIANNTPFLLTIINAPPANNYIFNLKPLDEP